MNRQRIEFNSDRRVENYLESIFTQCNYPFVKEKENGRTAFSFYADKEAKNAITEAVLVNFYKMKELTALLREKNDRAFDALLGSLIGFGQDDDREKIEKILEKTDAINIDGLYNFRLDELREDYGIQVFPIVTVREVISFLHNNPVDGKVYIDDEMKAKMEAYLEQYGTKG